LVTFCVPSSNEKRFKWNVKTGGNFSITVCFEACISFEEGTQKVTKFVAFKEFLTIHPSQLSNNVQLQQRQYKLFAVISHIGKQATGGHYVCDIRQRNGRWMHFDDSSVFDVKLEDVLDRNAYLLIYEQMS